MRVAVVGGGLFGCTAAIYAARAGHEVHLYEAKPELMCGATASTYSRLHRGYHYPRSRRTGEESRAAEKSFRREYGPAVIDGGEQLYVVPPRGSHVSVDQFRAFIDNQDLPFCEEGGVFQVVEPRINLAVLQQMVRQKVQSAGVTVHLGARAAWRLRADFDRIVIATYSSLNEVLREFGHAPQAYKFQVVERPIARLPEGFRNVSIVVVDGPFGCIDPLDDTELHVLGHVVHTIHWQNTGLAPFISEDLQPLIDQGVIAHPAHTRFRQVVDDLARYVPDLAEAVHVGSSFVVRAVLANQEATDARPTLVERLNEQVIKVFSGKLGTAVRAARDVVQLLESTDRFVSGQAPAGLGAPAPDHRSVGARFAEAEPSREAGVTISNGAAPLTLR